MSWCREVARHDDGVLDNAEDDELFNLVNSVIELLLADDVDRLAHFHENRFALFETLADELDEIVRKELVSRIIGYDIGRKARCDLFRDHFPTGVGQDIPFQEAEQSLTTSGEP